MDSALRPRDIQARIRAGESPEDVAAAAQTSVEAIMLFADPVLAERAHVARTAQKASLRRRSGEAPGRARTLGEAAELFFADHSLHDEDVEWDAWRRPTAAGPWSRRTLVGAPAARSSPTTCPAATSPPRTTRPACSPASCGSRAEPPPSAPTQCGGSAGARPGRAAPRRRRHRAGPRPRPADEAGGRATAAAADGPPDRGPRPGAAATLTGSPLAEPDDVPLPEDLRDDGPGAEPELESTAEARGSLRRRPGRRDQEPTARSPAPRSRRAAPRSRRGTRSCSAAARASDRRPRRCSAVSAGYSPVISVHSRD